MDNENNKGGRIVFMPDIEYKSWVNRNKALLDNIIETGQVPGYLLNKEPSKGFLIRYLEECGYGINFE